MKHITVNVKGTKYPLLCARSLGSLALRCGAKRFGMKNQSNVLHGYNTFVAFFDDIDNAKNFYGFMSKFQYDPEIFVFKIDSMVKKGKIWYRVYCPIIERPMKQYFYTGFRSLCKYYIHNVYSSCLFQGD